MNTNCLIEKNYTTSNSNQSNNNIEQLDINSLFKLEETTIKKINKLENQNKNLDIIYLKYHLLKNKLKEKINNEKKLLIKINEQKEEYNIINQTQKLTYLTKEYYLLLKQTKTSNLINQIKEIEHKINLAKKESLDPKLTLQYTKLKNKYNKIILSIDNENNNEFNIIPTNLNTNEKIIWYEKRIEKLIEKKMIFDNYLYSLENLYKDIIEKRMLETTH